jgi:hypothetical protein
LNTTGIANTAIGWAALYPNTTGSANTAVGFEALSHNIGGSHNVAFGGDALYSNTHGHHNTAIGIDTLVLNETGSFNTAIGNSSLLHTTGNYNTANGSDVLHYNTTGSYNTASGANSLIYNISGSYNAAFGGYALGSNQTGVYNTALGWGALYRALGSSNIALGVNAGRFLTGGSHNIYLGHTGSEVWNSLVSESGTMRLGQVQTRTFIAGIFGKTASGGSQVFINSQGQLGTVLSSARYKRDIQDMGEESQGLLKLRPVTFLYKEDLEGQKQYGLIAEEVAKVYPDLVVRGAKGEVESVQYHELIPMLLNEVQRQQQKLEVQAQQLTTQGYQLAELQAQNERLQAALVQQNAAFGARLEQLEQGARRLTTVSAR